MKEKILELIYKELEHIGSENIFKFQNDYNYEYQDTNPFKNYKAIKSRYEKYIKVGNCKYYGETYENIMGISYSLTFDDGEPSINVGTRIISSTPKKVLITTIFLFKKLYNHVFENTSEIVISCGNFVFTLTKDEEVELTEKTKFAFQLYTLAKEKKYEEEITEKLTLRLKKWEK